MNVIWILFDWGDTLMSEVGPADLPMALWPEVRVIPDAGEVLAALAGRYRLGVATNAAVSDRAMIERALDRAGLLAHVAELFCYRELGVKKAEPAYWAAVVARLGVAPSQICMVGDTLGDDVLAPRAAGLEAIWLNWKGQPAVAGVRTVASLRELLTLL